jgi:aspartyl/asparaginyl-tRNA synthetase
MYIEVGGQGADGPCSLSNGASVRLRGRLVDSLGKGQAKELQVESVDLLGESPEVRNIIVQCD